MCRGAIVEHYLNTHAARISATTENFLQIEIRAMRQKEEPTPEQLDVGKGLPWTHSRGLAEFGKCKEKGNVDKTRRNLLITVIVIIIINVTYID